MLNGGPVNELFCLRLLCFFVALSEPTYDRETFATRDGQDFVKRVGFERDQHSGFSHQRKRRRRIVKIQRAAGERVIQKHDDRYPPDPQVIEVELMRVAVLVTNEEVALLVTQKLRPLAVGQADTKVVLERRFLS